MIFFAAPERRRYERELASAHRQLEDAEADRAALLREAHHRALHDPLTGLPNRRHLEENLLGALASAGEQRNRVGVLFYDVNKFKLVNDTLGHAAGDQVLEHVALMLSQAVRGAVTVTRYSGDEFVVLIPRLEHAAELEAVAERVRSCLAGAVTIGGSELRLGMSVGQAKTAVPADADPAAHKELA
ncbi:GGDEF domain-containing protein, partial [Microbacterium sp. Bi128]|uniref:GGDEF domain-containing protein n=1 Tax=Microbacterium sp. Bi128 TaxID=2821115 RepID=UPI001E630046